ncbi:E3 ubiquitin-protein ligase At3g02290 [Elaeis guineensis]|uniref:RING-type E3 ubiquitin transferase n=1 Tax=Elaeis guineensis var. tenera TaxID=51953 RepID=A0A6I9RB65_ELAGV|nr:E3 ubiquitin-protein ligase At3g02290 [Elaeis guineensis]
MGSVFCCLRADDYEENENPNTPVCSSCFAQQIINVYIALFQREQVRVSPSSEQGAASLASPSLIEGNSIVDTYHPPPRPLPFDDPRCSQLQHRHGLVSRGNKGSAHFHEVSQPIRCNNDTDKESTGTAKSWGRSDYEGGPKICCPESSLDHLSTEVASAVPYVYSSSEDEDVCPTCLEEYTSENPRIILQCTHHFHLSCIYEWMERSEACPVCGKVMIFNETA